MRVPMKRKLVLSAVAGLAVLATLVLLVQQIAALPEYATRTNEPCATCHINPAGGGQRTERGQAWVAAGKPDKVPTAAADSATPTPAQPLSLTPSVEVIVVGTPSAAGCSQLASTPATTGCGGN